jgi:hypothetical protein
VIGGPAPDVVRASLVEIRERTAELVAIVSTGGPSALERALGAGDPLPAPVT